MVTIDQVRQVTFLTRASNCTAQMRNKNLLIEALDALAKEREFWLERAKEVSNESNSNRERQELR